MNRKLNIYLFIYNLLLDIKRFQMLWVFNQLFKKYSVGIPAFIINYASLVFMSNSNAAKKKRLVMLLFDA